MQTEILLNGISFDQFKEEFRTIVQIEVQKIVSGLTTTPEPEPELLTRKQTAKFYGISLPTLNEWTKKGIIPAKRIGGSVRYEKQVIHSSLNEIKTLKYRRA